MPLYLDCEFNGFGGELISMALVSDTGREFYAELEIDAPYEPWVAENVAPHLTGPLLFPEQFREGLLTFLRSFSEVEIVADWPSDPYYLLLMLLGADHAETVNVPMRIVVVNIEGDLPSAVPHNALSDARAIRDVLIDA